MNLVGDPAAINAMASLVDAKAAQVSAWGQQVQRQTSSCRWECAKADRFRYELAGRVHKADQLSGQMHTLASRLRAVAVQVQEELDVLHSLEQRVRALLDDWVVRPEQALWSGTQWRPWNLPGSGDPAWYDVARSLEV